VPARGAGRPGAIRFHAGLIAACALALQGCGDAFAVEWIHRDRVLIPGTEIAAGVVYDLNLRAIVRRVGPPLTDQGFSIYRRSSASLYTVGRLASGDDVLLELDVRTGAQRRRHVLSGTQGPIRSNGVAFGRLVAALDPVRDRMYVWNSERAGQFGVAVMDLATGEAVDFRRVALRRGGVSALPPNARFTEGAVLVYGDDGNPDFSRAVIYALTGTPLAVRDSIVLAPPSRTFLQVDVSADGRELLVGTNSQILRIDAESKVITARATRPNTGAITRSPTDGRFFLAAPGTVDRPTPNLIHVLQPSLELAGVADLRSLPESQLPLGIAGCVVSGDGQWLYVLTGVSRTGPLYGPQETAILVVDAMTLRVSNVHALGTFGTGTPGLTR
jgi:hypothetical protein